VADVHDFGHRSLRLSHISLFVTENLAVADCLQVHRLGGAFHLLVLDRAIEIEIEIESASGKKHFFW
jgi:hypothetical protein